MKNDTSEFDGYLTCKALVKLSDSESLLKLNKNLSEILQKNSHASYVDVWNNLQLSQEPFSIEAEDNKVYTICVGSNETLSIVIKGLELPINKKSMSFLIEVYKNIYRSLNKASTDRLTGLLNRQALDEYIDNVYASDAHQNRASNKTRIVAIADIDHFKAVNDNYGHIYGDEILLRLAQIAKQVFRFEDWLFRYGGEEFVFILNDIDQTHAHQALERFREKIEQTTFSVVGNVTISIGYVELDCSKPFLNILNCADQALYYSKDNGRNQINNFKKLLEKNLILDSSNKTVDDDIELF